MDDDVVIARTERALQVALHNYIIARDGPPMEFQVAHFVAQVELWFDDEVSDAAHYWMVVSTGLPMHAALGLGKMMNLNLEGQVG